MREAVYNQFDNGVWTSTSRNIVQSKFNVAMTWMGTEMSLGKVELRTAIDFFGRSAFRNTDSIWRLDPLTGKNRFFHNF